MSHQDAPPRTPEQIRMEDWYHANTLAGHHIGFGRNKRGEYHAEFATLAYRAWMAAQKKPTTSPPDTQK